jgi:hypothetical protein
MVYRMEIIFFVPPQSKVGVSVGSLAQATMNSISKSLIALVMLACMAVFVLPI